MLHHHDHWIPALAIVLMVGIEISFEAPFSFYSPAAFEIQNVNNGNSSNNNEWVEEGLEKTTIDFQRLNGLHITGLMDNETMQALSQPWGVVKNKDNSGTNIRCKRYVLSGRRWNMTDLTYRISKYSKQLDRAIVDQQIAKAFGLWSEHTDLTFTPKDTGAVNIEIRFEEGDHGDGSPFDGPNGRLSHGSFPHEGGEVHFDDDEQWTIDTLHGTNLFQRAVHQFGHSLGLRHSDVRSSVMSPLGHDYDPKFRLDSDDIKGIQALYGAKTKPLSNSSKTDAIYYDSGDKMSVSKVDTYYKEKKDAGNSN